MFDKNLFPQKSYIKVVCQVHNTTNIWFKVDNRNTRKRCGICSKLTVKSDVNDLKVF